MDWTRGPTIGRGSSATVSLATSAAGGVFAVKSADLPSSSSLRWEESLLSQLCSPYVIGCFGSDTTIEDGKHVFNLFLEYAPRGTLSDLIRSRRGALEESAVQFYARRLLLGLSYLHRKGIVHCDIKGQNILIGDGGLMIADFGCATTVGSDGSGSTSFAGTPAYMAPEVARGESQGFPADIWAVGCTVVEMATGSNPWPGMKDPAAVLYRIAFSDEVPVFPVWFSNAGKDFLGKCFARDAERRWTAEELLRHPFISSAEENCRGIWESGREYSPNSVMDGSFWNGLEASNSETGIASTSDPPAGRVRDLAGDGLPMERNTPVWTETEGECWLTVRGNLTEDLTEAGVSVTSLSRDEDVIETMSSLFGYLNGYSFVNNSVSREDRVNVKDYTFRTAIIVNGMNNFLDFKLLHGCMLIFNNLLCFQPNNLHSQLFTYGNVKFH